MVEFADGMKVANGFGMMRYDNHDFIWIKSNDYRSWLVHLKFRMLNYDGNVMTVHE